MPARIRNTDLPFILLLFLPGWWIFSDSWQAMQGYSSWRHEGLVGADLTRILLDNFSPSLCLLTFGHRNSLSFPPGEFLGKVLVTDQVGSS